MKTLNEYLNLPYRMEIVEDQTEGGFVVSYPDLPGCITCGSTIEEAIQNSKDAKAVWIEAALEEGKRIGEERGRKIGEEHGRTEIILNSLRNNRTAEEVAEFLNIPLEEVKAVEKKLLLL